MATERFRARSGVVAVVAWGAATSLLTLGTALSCRFILLVPGAHVGPACADGTPPADRLDGILVPQAGSTSDPVFWAQLVFNVAWFLPVGVWAARRCSHRAAPLLLGAAIGLTIEVLQFFATATRYPSLLDVACNAAGAAVGGALAGRFRPAASGAGAQPAPLPGEG
jgi:hypothetical protein